MLVFLVKVILRVGNPLPVNNIFLKFWFIVVFTANQHRFSVSQNYAKH